MPLLTTHALAKSWAKVGTRQAGLWWFLQALDTCSGKTILTGGGAGGLSCSCTPVAVWGQNSCVGVFGAGSSLQSFHVAFMMISVSGECIVHTAGRAGDGDRVWPVGPQPC